MKPKQFKFKSGIRVIEIEATTLAEAKRVLTHKIGNSAFTDPTWNWKIYINGTLTLDGEEELKLDYSLISDVEVDGIDTSDYPDFCDAFICSASYDGREMTDAELDQLNDDGDFVYQAVQDYLF